MSESGERSRESLSERNLMRTQFSKAFEARGLTAENMNYLLENPGLLDNFVPIIKAKLQQHQSPNSSQWRAARERLDNIDPKHIYDTAMAIRKTHGRLSIKAVGDAIDPGLYNRFNYSTSRPRTLAQQAAYKLAEEGKPWPSETESAIQKLRTGIEKIRRSKPEIALDLTDELDELEDRSLKGDLISDIQKTLENFQHRIEKASKDTDNG